MNTRSKLCFIVHTSLLKTILFKELAVNGHTIKLFLKHTRGTVKFSAWPRREWTKDIKYTC